MVRSYNIDDLIQIAGIGLTKTYNSYDVDKGKHHRINFSGLNRATYFFIFYKNK
ncbi:Hypothetical protein CKL_0418 [Clostridium kluyveri DSM 555]|uniref:Uncharacterized protein n=1 Tax=Clostridium kluyveri (strain ATCC 8527 / DSM 555 / NBRC 12016 / NCIMB 10680 / K1) TaxID=431943 RepID=A5N591_CLOK5|nr:Hypothetical protein CKL_0418 [Clostridium kluyveri DSM 555]